MKPQLCKRIKFNSGNETVVLLGIITAETDIFLEFQTSKTQYKINKNFIFSVEDTQIPFKTETIQK